MGMFQSFTLEQHRLSKCLLWEREALKWKLDPELKTFKQNTGQLFS